MDSLHNGPVSTFAALADPTRLRIVELLTATDELPAGKIAESFPSMTRAAVSRHLRTLEDAGLLSVRARAQQRLYRLDPGPLAELDRWLDRYRALWTTKIGALKAHLEER
jgi:DNA-binding transcriptional ArsR family regulator